MRSSSPFITKKSDPDNGFGFQAFGGAEGGRLTAIGGEVSATCYYSLFAQSRAACRGLVKHATGVHSALLRQ